MSVPVKVLFSWTFPIVGTGPAQGGTCIIDASVNEQHAKSAQVTEHQVETGINVADHIRALPGRLTIEGVITNTPIDVPTTQADGVSGSVQNVTARFNGQEVTYQALAFDGAFDRVRQSFGAFGDAIAGSALFSIVTTLASYENYACESFEVQRNAENGNVLRFTAGFREIRFVDTATADPLSPSKIPPKIRKKRRGNKAGKQLAAGAAAGANKRAQSFAHALING